MSISVTGSGIRDAAITGVTRAPSSGGVRFAPSPTGLFHIGNLRTAWISWLWAQHLGVPWVVRFEDIDRPRVLAGSRESQLEHMSALGLVPDVTTLQSEFITRHWDLFERGVRSRVIYACDCSRREVQAAIASAPHDGVKPVYSGRCRTMGRREMSEVESIAWRFRMSVESGVEDFIVARTGPVLDDDGLPSRSEFVPAYHWACAIDDFDGEHVLLVRSADLRSAAPVQRAIQRWLASESSVAIREPALFHTSLITSDDGHRLEKRTKGVTWPELVSAGFTAQTVLAQFGASFDRSLLSTPVLSGVMAGELHDEVRLSHLIPVP